MGWKLYFSHKDVVFFGGNDYWKDVCFIQDKRPDTYDFAIIDMHQDRAAHYTIGEYFFWHGFIPFWSWDRSIFEEQASLDFDPYKEIEFFAKRGWIYWRELVSGELNIGKIESNVNQSRPKDMKEEARSQPLPCRLSHPHYS